MYLDASVRDRIEQKLCKLNGLRPLPRSAVKKLQERLHTEMAYNSNAIEGNSLTLRETFLIIHEGITIKGKPLKDHLEAKDHDAALNYLYELVAEGEQAVITDRLIRTLHQLVTYATEREFSGKYRNSNVFIAGAHHIPPDALLVPEKMQQLLSWLYEGHGLHVIEKAAILHHRLVNIHPFFDGNGRTARLIMNVLLMQNGYPLTIILKNDRKKYYRLLAEADKGNVAPLTLFVAQAVERTLDIYLKVLTPISEKREKYQTLSEIAENTPYSAKYLNLLARTGKIAAHKEGRVWLTTQSAIAEYMDKRERKSGPGRSASNTDSDA